MPAYGEKSYWNERYCSIDKPFDWVCSWDQLCPIVSPLIDLTKKADGIFPHILIVGCGNAPFSSDVFYKGGYTNLVNIDYSEVVIKKQKSRFPEMDWRVMDALDMGLFKDGTFDCVIDKSLTDTTLCYRDGDETTRRLFSELHRVLKPGGRLITVSLHTPDEVLPFAQDAPDCNFACAAWQIQGETTDENDEHETPSFHTFAVFDKLTGLSAKEKRALYQQHPLEVNGSIRYEDMDVEMESF